MIDDETNDLRIHICRDNKRDKKTLTDMLLKYVEVGTTVVSDMWAGYKNFNKYGYKHVTVNHSEHFVDPTTGAHTQKIEGAWHLLKRRLGRGGLRKKSMAMHLAEYMFQKHIRKGGSDPFLGFLSQIVNMYGV